MRSILLFILCLIMGTLTTLFSILYVNRKIESVNDIKLRHSYSSVCKVKSRVGIGTGVLLNTGYILSAAHVVDSNLNNKLDLDERKVVVSFGKADSHSANVVYFNMDMDYCVLESPESVRDHIDSSVKLTASVQRLASKVYTIGYTNSQPPLLSEGRIGTPVNGVGRSSCYIYSGNSGGPLFNSNHDVIGIVFAMGFEIKTDSFVTSFQDCNGNTKLIFGESKRFQPVNGISFFTQSSSIYTDMLSKSIQVMVLKPDGPLIYDRLTEPFSIGLIKSTVNVALFLFFIFFIKRHLFSQQLS